MDPESVSRAVSVDQQALCQQPIEDGSAQLGRSTSMPSSDPWDHDAAVVAQTLLPLLLRALASSRPAAGHAHGGEKAMDTNLLILIVVLVLLFGGGGFYWSRRR
jgi:hypothetical protein